MWMATFIVVSQCRTIRREYITVHRPLVRLSTATSFSIEDILQQSTSDLQHAQQDRYECHLLRLVGLGRRLRCAYARPGRGCLGVHQRDQLPTDQEWDTSVFRSCLNTSQVALTFDSKPLVYVAKTTAHACRSRWAT
jgi:hypothetical protein